MARDTIVIAALELRAHLGVPDAERSAPQRLTATLLLEPTRDFRDLGDELEKTVDYHAVTQRVQAFAAARPRKLLETLAEEIAALVLAEFAVAAVEVELQKFILTETKHVAVRIRREQ